MVGGTNDRNFRAFDAKSGKPLWEFKTNSGVTGVPSSFAIDGVQYVAVQSGWGVDAQRIQDALAKLNIGWNPDVPQGGVVAFPRGERGAHGYENRSDRPVRLLMFSEQNAPNVSVYPDAKQVGIYDIADPGERRFGALFDLADAVSGYGGGQPAS